MFSKNSWVCGLAPSIFLRKYANGNFEISMVASMAIFRSSEFLNSQYANLISGHDQAIRIFGSFSPKTVGLTILME